MLINGKKYRITVGAIAPILYNLKFGQSAIKDFTFGSGYDFEKTVRLIYCTIRGEKPEYKDFMKDCMSDRKFMPKSVRVIRDIFRMRPHPKRTADDNDSDESTISELEVLVLFSNMNLPQCLLYECSLYQLMEIIGLCGKMKSPDYIRNKQMSNNQVKSFYHITPEQEKAILKALKEGEK